MLEILLGSLIVLLGLAYSICFIITTVGATYWSIKIIKHLYKSLKGDDLHE